jgi:RNA polymerase sigma factor for flagellar operon FliA
MIVAESVWREYYRSRDENLKDELVLAHLSLVKYLAGRLAIRLPAHISQEDLESYGIFGLLEAVEKYNPDLGVSFKSYAYNRIRGAMLDEIRKLNWVSRTTWQKVQRLNATRERLQKELGEHPTNEALAAAMNMTVTELRKLLVQANMMAISSLDEAVPTSSGETVCLRELIADDAISSDWSNKYTLKSDSFAIAIPRYPPPQPMSRHTPLFLPDFSWIWTASTG